MAIRWVSRRPATNARALVALMLVVGSVVRVAASWMRRAALSGDEKKRFRTGTSQRGIPSPAAMGVFTAPGPADRNVVSGYSLANASISATVAGLEWAW